MQVLPESMSCLSNEAGRVSETRRPSIRGLEEPIKRRCKPITLRLIHKRIVLQHPLSSYRGNGSISKLLNISKHPLCPVSLVEGPRGWSEAPRVQGKWTIGRHAGLTNGRSFSRVSVPFGKLANARSSFLESTRPCPAPPKSGRFRAQEKMMTTHQRPIGLLCFVTHQILM